MVIFFIRSYNDIDHIVPIAYKMAEGGNANGVLVLSLNPFYDIHSDYRLDFLKDACGVKVDYVYKHYRKSFRHRLISSLICAPSFKSPASKIIYYPWLAYSRFLRERVYKKIAKRIFSEEQWILGLLTSSKARLLVFDYAKPSQFIIGELLKGAKELGIGTMAVPHGIRQWRNSEWLASPDTEEMRKFGEGLPFDTIIVPNEEYKNLMLDGKVPAERLTVLGSARFSDEWIKVMPKTDFYNEGLPKTDKLKVVFMEGGYRFLVEEGIVADTLNRLSRLDEICLMVKPKTRNPALKLEELKSSIKIAKDIPSPALIKWADAVIVGNTSILFEVFLQGKTLIFPAYFYSFTMIMEEMGACWAVKSYDELEEALKKMRRDKTFKPYSEENVDRFFTEMIYGGERDRSVLEDYKKIIEEKANKC